MNFNRQDRAHGGSKLGKPGELNECNFHGASRQVMPAKSLHVARHPGRQNILAREMRSPCWTLKANALGRAFARQMGCKGRLRPVDHVGPNYPYLGSLDNAINLDVRQSDVCTNFFTSAGHFTCGSSHHTAGSPGHDGNTICRYIYQATDASDSTRNHFTQNRTM